MLEAVEANRLITARSSKGGDQERQDQSRKPIRFDRWQATQGGDDAQRRTGQTFEVMLVLSGRPGIEAARRNAAAAA